MNILRPVDIEDVVRLALTDYLNVFCRPLPEKFLTPCLLVSATGGTSKDTIDSFNVSLSARAETDAESYEYLRTAIGILEEQARRQVGALRSVNINSIGQWGTDPVRPDLKLSTATVIVTAHRETFEIKEES